MATENDDDARQNEPVETTTTTTDKPERAEKPERREREARHRHDEEQERSARKPKTTREVIRDAIKEHSEPKPERPRKSAATEPNSSTTEAAPKDGAPVADKPIPPKDNGTAKETAPEARFAAPPEALSKDIKARWNDIDPAVRSEFARLEDASKKGIETLRDRYKTYDQALDPVRDELKMLGKSEAEAIRMLVDWRRALSGPQKAQAFAALARAEGIDLSQLAPRPSNGQAPQQQQPTNDAQSILRPYLDPLSNKINALETEIQRRDRERVQSDISSFAKDKPHFDKVKVMMGHMMNSGQVSGSTPQEAFDDAYDRACWAIPEVRAAIQAEDVAKREAEARASQEAAAKKAAEAEEARKRKEAEEVAKARKAGVGPRGGSPSGMGTAATNKGSPSARESLVSAIREVRAAG